MSNELTPGFCLPFHGKCNTEFHNDWGTKPTQVQRNAEHNRSFGSVQPNPMAFQPFFRFGAAVDGRTNMSESNRALGGRGQNQPEAVKVK